MTRFRLSFALAAGVLGLTGAGLTQPGSAAPGAKVDWAAGVLVAQGIGVAPKGLSQAQAEVRALAAARADAQRLLVSAVQGVQVTSETTVRNFELEDDTVKASVSGLLQGAAPVANSEALETKADGSMIARVSYSVPLYGENSLAAIVLPKVTKKAGVIPVAQRRPAAPPRTATSTPSRTATATATGTATSPAPVRRPPPAPTHTGLIVNAVGQGYDPCLVPKIVPAGDPVWATAYAEEPAARKGVAAFVRSRKAAGRLAARGAPKQLEVKATRVTGAKRCDVVLGAADTALVRSLERDAKVLSEFKVTFVY